MPKPQLTQPSPAMRQLVKFLRANEIKVCDRERVTPSPTHRGDTGSGGVNEERARKLAGVGWRRVW